MTATILRDRSAAFRIADEIDRYLDKNFWLMAFLFAAQILVWDLFADTRAKLWLDEIYTMQMAHLANPAEIVRATMEGCDNAAPITSILVHYLLPFVHPEALALRLVSSLSYFAMILCIFAFCRRRLSAVYGWVATLLVCHSTMWYGTEGRAYAMMLAGAAGALLSWQLAAEGIRRVVTIPALAFSLALMTGVHYYSIFFLVPLFLAEVVRFRISRELDFGVPAAMVPAVIVLGLHYPLIVSAHKFQLHFWSPATWSSIAPTYQTILFELSLLPACILALFSAAPESRGFRQKGLTVPEWVLTGGMMLMPLSVIVFSIYFTHVFVDRYTFWAVAGIGVFTAALVSAAARNRNAVGATLIILLLGVIAVREGNALKKHPLLGEPMLQELSAAVPPGTEPIVVADHFVYTELAYIAPPPLRGRLIYPLSQDLDLRYRGTDTGSLMMAAIGERFPLRIVDLGTMLSTYPRFVLASRPQDYLARHLLQLGFQVVPINLAAYPDLYLVTAPRP